MEHHLKNLVAYAISYFKGLLEKYGKGRERKTAMRNFDTIVTHTVAANNQKLYVNRKEGFVGYGMKKDELIGACSDLDDVIVFRKDGKCLVTKIAEKVFVGKDIMHVAVFKYIGIKLVIQSLQWIISGDHSKFFTVSKTPLQKKIARSSLSS